jgi:restriction system protein
LTTAKLAEWLEELRQDEIEAAEYVPQEVDDFDDDDAHDESSRKRHERRAVWNFPSDEALNEFVAIIDKRSQDEIDLVLRHLLIGSCALGNDHARLEAWLTLRDRGDRRSLEQAEAMMQSPHFRRVYAYFGGETSELPWEGIRWVMQLLPDRPATALVAIDAYFLAHMWDMTDSLIHAMSDAEAIIRTRYIGVPETQEERRQILYGLTPRQFEVLIQQLYEALGYDTELTPNTRDGGRDVIARRSQSGRVEHLLIECKRHADNIDPLYVRALLGVVSNEHASAGKIITTSSFSDEARNEMKDNHRLELINGLELVVLLNEHLGWTWPTRLDRLVSERNVVIHQE